ALYGKTVDISGTWNDHAFNRIHALGVADNGIRARNPAHRSSPAIHSCFPVISRYFEHFRKLERVSPSYMEVTIIEILRQTSLRLALAEPSLSIHGERILRTKRRGIKSMVRA